MQFQNAVDPAPPSAVLSRSEQVKRDALEWKRRHGGMDFEHEM